MFLYIKKRLYLNTNEVPIKAIYLVFKLDVVLGSIYVLKRKDDVLKRISKVISRIPGLIYLCAYK
jgi:hypothetical protein